MRDLPTLLLAGSMALVLTACSAASGANPSATALPPSTTPPATSPPSIGGGSSGGDPGSGIGSPVAPPISDPGGTPPMGTPTIVVPRPGRLAVHEVGVFHLEARVQAGHAIVRASWWSGVEPCSVLDSVIVERVGSQIQLTVREGSDQLGVACIEIAMLKATDIDLGTLPAGTYTVSASGEAPPIQVVIG